MKKITYIWQDRKRTFLGLPLSFTKYMLTEDRLFVEKGFLNSVLDEENLYRVRDVRVVQAVNRSAGKGGAPSSVGFELQLLLEEQGR